MQGRFRLWLPSAYTECNGVGADWMPRWTRILLTCILPRISVAAAIHDMDYWAGGDEKAREKADKRFRENALTIVRHYYGWFPPLRRRLERLIDDMYMILRIAGGIAWREAKNRRLAKEAEKEAA